MDIKSFLNGINLSNFKKRLLRLIKLDFFQKMILRLSLSTFTRIYQQT